MIYHDLSLKSAYATNYALFVISGRAPALLDSLDQAFLTAPLFVFMEVFFFFGYRPSFHAEIMQVVRQNVEEFRKRKAKTN